MVIVLHAKAMSDMDSWQRRVDASRALKTYLDGTWPSAKVLVIGDFNDDVDVSISSPEMLALVSDEGSDFQRHIRRQRDNEPRRQADILSKGAVGVDAQLAHVGAVQHLVAAAVDAAPAPDVDVSNDGIALFQATDIGS